MNATRSRRRTDLLISIAMIALAFLVFGRTLSHGFLQWDDGDEIFANPTFLPPTLAKVASQWTSLPDETHYYKPVTQTAWAAIAAVAYDPQRHALNPRPFHLASILVHAASAIVVYHLLRRIIRAAATPAFLGSALFLLHPVQVETVAWASGFKDLLCGLFSLLAIHQWLAATDPQNPGRRSIPYALATAMFVIALLAKPAAVVVPFLALVAEWLAYRPPAKRLWARLVPWIAMAAAFSILTKLLMPAAIIERPPPWARPLVATDALTFYFRKLLLPINLAPDYGHRPSDVLSHSSTYVSWVAPVALAILTFHLARRRRVLWPLGALALFVLALLPTLGLVPTEFQYYSTVADHYLYLAMLAPALAACAVAARFPRTVGAAIALLVPLSVVQAGYWRDDLTLWTHTVAVNPRSFAGYSQLGMTYLQAGQLDESILAYRQALAINPNQPNAHDIWIPYARRGDLDSAIAEITAYIDVASKMPALQTRLVPTLQLYKEQMLRDRAQRHQTTTTRP